MVLASSWRKRFISAIVLPPPSQDNIVSKAQLPSLTQANGTMAQGAHWELNKA